MTPEQSLKMWHPASRVQTEATAQLFDVIHSYMKVLCRDNLRFLGDLTKCYQISEGIFVILQKFPLTQVGDSLLTFS